MTKNNLWKSSNEKEQSLQDIKWQKKALKELKWQKGMFKGAQITKRNS